MLNIETTQSNSIHPLATYEKALIALTLIWGVSVTIVRGLVWPNDWAAAHWLITFQFDTLKRALPGTIISPLFNINGFRSDLIIGFFSGLFLLLFVIGLLWLCAKIIFHAQNKAVAILVSLAFLTSPYIVMSANLIGYYDNIIILLTLLTCWLVRQERHFIGAFILSVSVFIHESVVLVGLPIVLFFALLHYSQKTQTTTFIQLLVKYCRQYWALLLLPSIAFCVLAGYQAVVFDQHTFIEAFRAELATHAFMKERSIAEVPPLLSISYTDFLSDQISLFQARLTNRANLALVLPTALLTIFYGLIALKQSPYRVQFWILFILCAATPLSLHAIAFDSSRIWTYPLVVLMIGLYAIHTLHRSSQQMQTQLPMIGLALLVLMANVNSHIRLMGQVVERFSQTERVIIYAPLLSILLLLLFFRLDFRLRRNDSAVGLGD